MRGAPEHTGYRAIPSLLSTPELHVTAGGPDSGGDLQGSLHRTGKQTRRTSAQRTPREERAPEGVAAELQETSLSVFCSVVCFERSVS